MTDKATVEIPSPVAGKVLALGGAAGAIMPVGAELIRIEVEGEGSVRETPAAAAQAALRAKTPPVSVAPPPAQITPAAVPGRISVPF